MKVRPLALPGVLAIEPQVFGDARGFFLETYHEPRYAAAGINCRFVQDNLSFSAHGVLRGLHYQNPYPQDKLVYVLSGEVFDVVVDVRRGSPTFGRWIGETLSAEKHNQLFVPKGYAHGFCVLSEAALFAYKCSDVYAPEAEVTVLWNDPEIGISWPVAEPKVSAKDAGGVPLGALPGGRLLSMPAE